MGVVMRMNLCWGGGGGGGDSRLTDTPSIKKRRRVDAQTQRCAFVKEREKDRETGKKTWRKLPTCNIQKDVKDVMRKKRDMETGKSGR